MIYIILFYKFLLIGLFSFGGGYTAIALIKESMEGFLEIGEGLLADFIAVSEMTPGPVAVNLATFIGAKSGGILGALVSTLAISLPAFIIIILYSKYFKKYEESPLIKSVYMVVRPTCFAIILSVGLILFIENLNINFENRIGSGLLVNILDIKALAIFGLIALGDLIYGIVKKKSIPAIPLIIFGGIFGLLAGII